MGTDKSIISFVAVDDLGKVLGFGELVPPVTLGAIYVAASAGRRGVASALFEKLEVKARELGMKVLRMDSSLTAVPFYIRHGFRELERGTHRLADGLMMNCVVMEKTLRGRCKRCLKTYPFWDGAGDHELLSWAIVVHAQKYM